MKSYKIFSIVFLFAAYNLANNVFAQNEYKSSKWLGESSEKKLANNFDWFREQYNNYNPDSISIVKLTAILPEYTILVFAGIWCGDSQRILPQFFKTMDKVKMPENRVVLYLLDEDMQSPRKLERKYSITNVPTFIILKKRKIEGKIEETDVTLIEKDILNAISKVR